MSKRGDTAATNAALKYQATHVDRSRYQDINEYMKESSKELKKMRDEKDKRTPYKDKLRELFNSGHITKEEQVKGIQSINKDDYSIAEKLIKHHSGSHHKEPEEEIKPKHKKHNPEDDDEYIVAQPRKKEESKPSVLDKYEPPKPEPKKRGRPAKEKVVKEKLGPVSLKTIGHELNTRTRKEKLSPEKKREIYDFIMKFD